jgi:hypothetical protein
MPIVSEVGAEQATLAPWIELKATSSYFPENPLAFTVKTEPRAMDAGALTSSEGAPALVDARAGDAPAAGASTSAKINTRRRRRKVEGRMPVRSRFRHPVRPPILVDHVI